MRRSFGGGSGMGGGNGGGGSSMLRTVQRAVRAGVGSGPPEPFSPSATNSTIASTNTRKTSHFKRTKTSATPNTALTLNSSASSSDHGTSAFSSVVKFPVSGVDIMEWECVDGNYGMMSDEERERERERGSVFYEDFVFGTVPSSDEVLHAVSALQQAFEPSSYTEIAKAKSTEDTSNETGVDWIEPSWDICSTRMLQPYRSNRVYDAFHLLQTEPSVQRMVMSLSSDKSVWDAVLNNEIVKELRSSITEASSSESRLRQHSEDKQGQSSDDASDADSNTVKDILSWILSNAKAKIMQLIDNITKFVNNVFQSPNEVSKGGDEGDAFEEKLKTSLFLSIVVLLIVVVTRAQSA